MKRKAKIKNNYNPAVGSLEANLDDACYRAYIRHPEMHGNVEALQLLVTVSHFLGDGEDEQNEREREQYESGEEDGYKEACREWVKPLADAVSTLLIWLKDETSKEDIAKAIEEVEDTLDEIRKANIL